MAATLKPLFERLFGRFIDGVTGRLAARMRSRAAMLHYGRCGSTVVGDLLAEHPAVYWDDEVFRRMFRGKCIEARFLSDPFRLLAVRMARAAARGHQVYGFESKCHPAYDLSAPILDTTAARLVRRLDGLGFRRFILLKRRNYLRQQISEEVGRQRATWHRPAGTRPRLHPITLDPARVRFGGMEAPLLDSFASRERGYAEIERLLRGRDVLRLTYEDDVRPGPLRAYRQICTFLDVAPQRPTVGKARTNPFPLPRLLRNYDAVAATLRGTRHAWMLDDPH